MPADVILKNANVLTMDAGLPAGEMVAIAGDKIMAVGGKEDVESVGGAGMRTIDCGGGTLVPGFNDAHLHLFSLIRKLLSIDLSPAAVGSIADIKEAVRRRAAETPPGTWLSGTDFNEFYLEEKRFPTREDIDEAAPDHLVVLSHRSLHACVLNSRALALAGITRETPEPPGTRIERYLDSGEPNGILYEMLGYVRGEVMPPLAGPELEEGMALADRHLLAYGITSLQEATYKNDPARWQTIGGFQASGKLRSRVYMMAGAGEWGKFREAGLVTGSGDDRLRLGAVKVMLTGTTPDLYPPPEELN
ncbi:MAG: amidohydrolase family protein, partial [Chloroflexota bacterium]